MIMSFWEGTLCVCDLFGSFIGGLSPGFLCFPFGPHFRLVFPTLFEMMIQAD